MQERAPQFVFGDADKLGVLTRELHVRILNCSSSGCLVETNAHREIGTIGSLRLAIDGEEFKDALKELARKGGINLVITGDLRIGKGADHDAYKAVVWKIAREIDRIARLHQPEHIDQKDTVGLRRSFEEGGR